MALSCAICGKSEFKVEVNIDMAKMYSDKLKIEINNICKACQTVYRYNGITEMWEIRK